MACTIDPLVEKRLPIVSTHLFECAAEVVGFDKSEGMALDVVLDGFPPKRVAEASSDHVQDSGSFGIGVCIEHIAWVKVASCDDGALVGGIAQVPFA